MPAQKVKPTPGPWHVAYGSVYQGEEGNENVRIALMARGVDEPTSPTERDANARLISASPDLLYALKRALVVISQHHPDKDCCSRDIETIKNAIRKAEENT